MTRTWKYLAVLFALLAVASLAHDVWRAYSLGNRFTLSAIGGLFQLYAPETHDAMRHAIADATSPHTFTVVFGPLLSLLTLIWTLGFAAIFTGLWLWDIKRRRKPHRPNFRHRPNY